MKQSITKEQWDELTEEQKLIFSPNGLKMKDCFGVGYEYPNIGQMIEFLGYDIFEISRDIIGWQVKSGRLRNVRRDELCDALWEAVKYKLSQI